MGAEGTVEVVEARCGVGLLCDGHSGCKERWGSQVGVFGVPLLGLGGERGEGFSGAAGKQRGFVSGVIGPMGG